MRLSSDGIEIPLGVVKNSSCSFGFSQGLNRSPFSVDLSAKEGHLLTVAPTGSGKGISSVIPTLLSYPGNTVVLDPKGENYAVTARYRRSLGQRVVVLDPFSITGEEQTDSLDPLKSLSIADPNFYDEVKALADHLMLGILSENDVFWDTAARQLLTTLIVYVKCKGSPFKQGLEQVIRLMNLPIEKLQGLLKGFLNGSGQNLVRYVQPFEYERKTASSVLGVLRTHLEYLMSPRVLTNSLYTSFDINELIEPGKLTIYLVIPPDKLVSHRGLVRCWLGVLMNVMIKARKRIQPETLFVLDEAAQIGAMEEVKQAINLLRGYGVRVWSFWQDLSQIKSLYPEDWNSIINNCQAVQMYGFSNLAACREAGELLGFYGYEQLMELDRNEQLIQLKGQLPVVANRLDYLTDHQYKGLFESNPYYITNTKATELDVCKEVVDVSEKIMV